MANLIGCCTLDVFYTETEARAIEIAENYFDFNMDREPKAPTRQPEKVDYISLGEDGQGVFDFEKIYAEHGRKVVYSIRPNKHGGFVIVFFCLKMAKGK